MTREELERRVGSDVSCETFDRLLAYVDLLRKWQPAINLIGPRTLEEVWERHIVDSLQLNGLDDRSDPIRWIDLGSGGGLPGIVIACARAGMDGSEIILVERDQRKAAFLKTVARSLALPIQIEARDILAVNAEAVGAIDIVSARALAPLSTLLGMANRLLKTGGRALFPKGRDWALELTEARKWWNFEIVAHPSATDPDGRILEIAAGWRAVSDR